MRGVVDRRLTRTLGQDEGVVERHPAQESHVVPGAEVSIAATSSALRTLLATA